MVYSLRRFLFIERLLENLRILSEKISKFSAAVLHDKSRIFYGEDSFEKAKFTVEIFKDPPNLSRAEQYGCFTSRSDS